MENQHVLPEMSPELYQNGRKMRRPRPGHPDLCWEWNSTDISPMKKKLRNKKRNKNAKIARRANR